MQRDGFLIRSIFIFISWCSFASPYSFFDYSSKSNPNFLTEKQVNLVTAITKQLLHLQPIREKGEKVTS